MDAPLWIALTLALVLGIFLGSALVGLRFARLERARRAVFGASAGIARLGLEALPARSAADILSGRITIVLGGVPYVINVLPRRASKEWLAQLDGSFVNLANALDASADNVPQILSFLTSQTDFMLSMLRAYDVDNRLPDDEYVEQYATDGEILAAMVEVWRAANPLAAIGAEAAAETMAGTNSAQPNSLPVNTGGEPTISPTGLPTSS